MKIEEKVQIIQRELLYFSLGTDIPLRVSDDAVEYILLRAGNPKIEKLNKIPYES